MDPPYNNAAGKKYATSTVNYTHLAEWCRSRHGQTIVCENAGADWLPFTTLTARRRGIQYGTADEKTAGEVVWTQETEPIGLWAYAVAPSSSCTSVSDAIHWMGQRP